MEKKNVYIIAGPNGSGKTTFATEFLPTYAKCPNFINADLIAKGLSPFYPKQMSLKMSANSFFSKSMKCQLTA